MPPSDDRYKAIQEGILRARLIRRDLRKYPTEYYPEVSRGLVKAYLATISQIIKEGEKFLDDGEDFDRGLEVAQIIENYKAFLLKIKK